MCEPHQTHKPYGSDTQKAFQGNFIGDKNIKHIHITRIAKAIEKLSKKKNSFQGKHFFVLELNKLPYKISFMLNVIMECYAAGTLHEYGNNLAYI